MISNIYLTFFDYKRRQVVTAEVPVIKETSKQVTVVRTSATGYRKVWPKSEVCTSALESAKIYFGRMEKAKTKAEHTFHEAIQAKNDAERHMLDLSSGKASPIKFDNPAL